MRAALDVVQRAVALTALAFLLAGCGCSSCEQDPVPVGGGPPPADRLADFTLEDVNPASATGALPLSVRQQLGTVSAWYFGHAT